MAIYTNDIVPVDLNENKIYRSPELITIGEGDRLGDRFGVAVLRNGEPVSLTGATCQGFFIRQNSTTVPLTGGISANMAYVDLDEACYAYIGQFSLVIKVVHGSSIATLRIVDGIVRRTTTDVVVDPGTVVPNLSDLLAAVAACEEAAETATEAAADIVYLANDENMLIPTEGADTTNNGVRRRVDGDEICFSGEATATRRYVLWGGYNATYTQAADRFRRILRAGTYKFHVSSTGNVNITSVRATYDTFSNEFTISDGDIVTLTADAIVGIYINNGTDYGVYGEASETRVTVTAVIMTAKDDVARDIARRATWEKVSYVKYPGELSPDGYPHQAFPDVVYADGDELIISRVSQSHYAPDDPSEWGGMSIERLGTDGILSHVRTLKVENFQDGTHDLQGHVGGSNANPTPDGRHLLISGWTTYNTSNHDNYLAIVSKKTFEVLHYLVNPCVYNETTKISLEGKPLFTPTGHIIACGYRGDYVYISRSDQAYGEVPFEDLTFTTQRIEAMAGNYNECSIGYTREHLYIMARNATNSGPAGLFVCEDKEGQGAWTDCQVVIKDHNGNASAIHEPKLLPFCGDIGLLWFVGANYRGATLRRAVLGFIDLNMMVGYFGVIGDNLGYGGYSGFAKYCESEFDVAYYKEGDGGPTDPTTAITSALMYKRVDARKLISQLCYYI